jgi:hypothetical protein
LSFVLVTTLVVLVLDGVRIYWYLPQPVVTKVTKDPDFPLGLFQGDRDGDNKRARTDPAEPTGITQLECNEAHLLDIQRTESAQACFVGQSDKFRENPYCFPSLFTQIGAFYTIVCSFGVHGEDNNSNHNMRVVMGLFNPPGGPATPINIVNFYPERCGSMSGIRNTLHGIWWLYGLMGEKWMLEDNIPFFRHLSSVSSLVFCTAISKDPHFDVDFAYEQGWHIQNITNGSSVLNHARGLEFWVRLVMEISVDRPSRQVACERVVHTVVRECKNGVGKAAADVMADGTPFPFPVDIAQRILALRYEHCPASIFEWTGGRGHANMLPGGHANLNSPFDEAAATIRLSFRGRPFTIENYAEFAAKQSEVITAQHTLMKSTKALTITAPPCVVLPPGGNAQWEIVDGKVKARKPKKQKRPLGWVCPNRAEGRQQHQAAAASSATPCGATSDRREAKR